MISRRLLIGGSGSFTGPRQNMVGLFNGRSASVSYDIGYMTSNDAGATWTEYGSNPVLTKSGPSGVSWKSNFVVDPCLLHDGSQYVVYYAGYDSANFRIGRSTSADLITWTDYASNPVIDLGTGTDPDATGANFPAVHFDGTTWRMWYTGWNSTTLTVCFADSSDGLTWTKHGTVIGLGSAGDFDDVEAVSAAVVKSGSTWYIYYTGRSDPSTPPSYRGGYATCTTPETAATYTKHGVLSTFSGNLGPMSDGLTYNSNQCRTMLPLDSGGYLRLGSMFWPTTGPYIEKSYRSIGSDLTTFSAPTGPVLTLTGWDATSAENPSAIYQV